MQNRHVIALERQLARTVDEVQGQINRRMVDGGCIGESIERRREVGVQNRHIIALESKLVRTVDDVQGQMKWKMVDQGNVV